MNDRPPSALRASSLLGLALFTALLALPSRPAAAEEPAASDGAAVETAQYRGLLSEAVSEYDARRFEEARALFRRAHDLYPNARTLRGIGMASFELREYVEALRALEASLVDQRRALTAPQRQQVEGLLERTRAFVGRFTPHLVPADGAQLRVDGAPVALEGDGTLLLSFGRHAVTAEAPGRVTETRELNVIGGERQELSFRLRQLPVEPPPQLEPSVVPPPPVPPAQTPPPVGATPKDGDQRPSHAAAWFVGAGAMAAGSVAGALWWRERSSEIDRCQVAISNNMICDNADKLSTQRKMAIGVTIGMAIGATALAIVGFTSLSGDKANDKPASQTALACAPDVGGMGCTLRVAF